MKRLVVVTLLAVVFGLSPLAHAALVDNGGGLIYDTDLNITWYDYTMSLDNYSRQSTQVTWAANLSVIDVNGKTINGWRLPRTVDG